MFRIREAARSANALLRRGIVGALRRTSCVESGMNDPTREHHERENAVNHPSTQEPRAHEAGLRRLPRVIAGIRNRLLPHLHSASEPCRIPAPVRIPVRRPMPRLSLAPVGLALGLALTLALAASEAPASTAWAVNADGRLVDVEVLVDGQAAPLYSKPGTWDRRYFQAFRGR